MSKNDISYRLLVQSVVAIIKTQGALPADSAHIPTAARLAAALYKNEYNDLISLRSSVLTVGTSSIASFRALILPQR